MLLFEKIQLEDKEKIKRYTSKNNFHLCEHCFADLYMWQGHYDTEVAFDEEFMYVKMKSFPEGIDMYLCPVGEGDLTSAINKIWTDAKERNIPFTMVSIPEELLAKIEELFPNTFEFSTSEDSADYIYSAESLITLKGKKLQSKRNFVNRFKAANEGHWQYEDVTPENKDEVYAYHLHWCELNGCQGNQSFKGETCAIKIALDNLASLDMEGGLIRLDGQIIAFTLGSKSTQDMYVMQIEKADFNIQGAYQMINQQFAERHFTDVEFVNREEDLGLEGLRKAKQSYYPVRMGQKYMAKVK